MTSPHVIVETDDQIFDASATVGAERARLCSMPLASTHPYTQGTAIRANHIPVGDRLGRDELLFAGSTVDLSIDQVGNLALGYLALRLSQQLVWLTLPLSDDNGSRRCGSACPSRPSSDVSEQGWQSDGDSVTAR